LRGVGNIDLGSRVTFDILGRRITARVTSVRAVDWRNARTGFLVLFRPGVLESAPQTFIGAINGPETETERARFQRRLLDAYPNVSVIDVLDIVRTVGRLLNNVTLAVSFLGGFVLLSGILILIGSIAMTKFQRIYETGVLRTLGARGRTLLLIIFVEYGLIGLVAGLTGALASIGLSYAVSRYVFEIKWAATPLLSFIGIVTTVLLVVSIGALASVDVLRRKPLAVLRSA
jgi:putative ABC transport system permease protein